MLVFIDESGCCGFRFARGADPVFAVAIVVFAHEIRIDGSRNREFRRDLSRYLRSGLRGKAVELRMTDSARDPLTQLADMCVGAIARAYRDRQQPDPWIKMLRPRIDDIRIYN